MQHFILHTSPLYFCSATASHRFSFLFFCTLILRPSASTLFPYTTLFRSERDHFADSDPVVILSHDFWQREFSGDRKSTRLNSSHVAISYAVFCLKKKSLDLSRFSKAK